MINYKTLIKSPNFQPYIKKMRDVNHHYEPFNYINKYHLEGDIWSHTMMVLDYVQNSLKSEDNDLYLVSLFHDIGKTYNYQIDKKKRKIQFINHWFYSGNIFRDYFLSHNFIDRKNKEDIRNLFDLYRIVQLHQINQFPQEIKDNLHKDLSYKNFLLLKDLCSADGKGRILDEDIKEAGYDKYFEKYKTLSENDFNNHYQHIHFSDPETVTTDLKELMNSSNHKKFVILLVAPPASGKSTIARKLSENSEFEVFTTGYDQIRLQLFCEKEYNDKTRYSMDTATSEIYQKAYDYVNKNGIDIHSILMEKINNQLKNNDKIVIVVDNTNASFKSRRKIIHSLFKKEEIHKVGIFIFNLTLEEIFQRNEKRNIQIKKSAVEHIYKTTAFPSLTEFDDIFVI